MKITLDLIHMAFEKYRPSLAFSGGSDSMVLLDIVTSAGYKPPLVYVDTQMELPESKQFALEMAKKYGCEITVAKYKLTPVEVWNKYGFPFLGKMPARMWMQKHRGDNSLGFKIDCSTCCRKIKIEPGRRAVTDMGCNASLTGVRGNADDRLRGMRDLKDGAVKYIKTDKLTNIMPLSGWTDMMIRRYSKAHELPVQSAETAGDNDYILFVLHGRCEI